MSIYYSLLLTIFSVVAIMMIIDPNMGMWIDLQFRNVVVQLKRRYYIITMGTVIKYQTWKMKQEFKKIRKEYGLPDETD